MFICNEGNMIFLLCFFLVYRCIVGYRNLLNLLLVCLNYLILLFQLLFLDTKKFFKFFYLIILIILLSFFFLLMYNCESNIIVL